MSTDTAEGRSGGCPDGRLGMRTESRCSACLRAFRDDRFHDLLSRREATVFLGVLSGAGN